MTKIIERLGPVKNWLAERPQKNWSREEEIETEN